jgi:uncharacterized protein (TIGR02246 family)
MILQGGKMRAARRLFLLTAILCGFCITAYAEDFKDAVKEGGRIFMDAATRHDAIAIAGLYHKDARVFPPNREVVKGREAIENFWRSEMTPSVKGFVVDTVDTDKEDDLGIETGTYEVKGPDDATLDKGKYVVVWKKDDGKWKMYRDIWNSSVAAPPAAASPTQ